MTITGKMNTTGNRRISVSKCIVAGMALVVYTANCFAQQIPVTPLFQKHEYLVRSFTAQDGLPVNSVNGIVQDEKGYLWFSTYDGLARYNGFEFRVFNTVNSPGMTTNRIDHLFLTGNDLLWLVNTNGTVTIKKESQFETFSKELVPGKIKQIVEDQSGRVWISGTDGITVYDDSAHTFRVINHPLLQSAPLHIESLASGGVAILNNEGLLYWKHGKGKLLISADKLPVSLEGIKSLKQLDKNYIWITGKGGAFLLNLSTSDIAYSYNPAETELQIVDIVKTTDDRYILISRTGVFVYHKNTGIQKLPKEDFPDLNRIYSVLEGKDGELIWIGDSKVFINDELAAEVPGIKVGLTDHFVDREGSLWFGTYRAGLYQIRRSNFVNLGPAEFPGLENIYSVIQDKTGDIWAGSINSGIFRLSDDGYMNWNNQNSLLDRNLAHFLYEDVDGAMYAGLLNNGLWKYDNNHWEHVKGFQQLTKSNTTIKAMFRKADRIFIGSSNSLIIWEDGAFRWFDDKQPDELRQVGVFRENSRGTIFAGTMGHGFSRIQGNSVITYTNQNGVLSGNSVRDIYIQADDTLWIATENSGLNRLILNGSGEVLSAKVITTADGLMHNSLHRIINDGHGYFWISSNGGLMRISIEALNSYADGKTDRLYVRGFNEDDGLNAMEANGGVQSAGTKTTDGRIWFPTQSGIVIVDPKIERTEDPPNVEIEDIITNDKVFNHSNNTLVLEADQRNFEIAYTSLTFTFPENVRFRYRLLDYDENWVIANDRRQAFYTKVPAGTYTFEVQASNNFNEWNPQPGRVTITVLPYYYETVWFYLLCGCILAGVLLLAHRRRIHNLKKNEKQLTKLVRERTRELRREKEKTEKQAEELKELDEIKSRFFTNLSHEFRTPLTLIINPLQQILSGAFGRVPEEISVHHRLMLRNSNRLLRLIDQLLSLSKMDEKKAQLQIEEIDPVTFTNKIVTLFEPSAADKNINLEIFHHPAIKNVWLDYDNMEKVIANLITNALKFTEPGGFVKVKFEESEDACKIIISDTGIGISREKQEHIFDRFYQIESGDTRRDEGVGIGLALVKTIIHQHQGTIDLESRTGMGSTFIISLKKGNNHFAQNDFKEEKKPDFIANAHTLFTKLNPPEMSGLLKIYPSDKNFEIATNTEADQLTVLVVEDNDDLRTFLCNLISKNYHVLDANNGADALELIKSELPDLIVADIMMPGLDGITLNSELKKDPTLASIPLIFLTAKNTPEAKVHGLLKGADAYLTKPFSADVLLAHIYSLIDSRMRLRKLLIEQSVNNHSKVNPVKSENVFVSNLNEKLEKVYNDPELSISRLAEMFHLNRSQLYRNIKKYTGLTPQQYLLRYRLEQAAMLLRNQSGSVSEVAYAAGFNSLSWFSKTFKEYYINSPSEYMASIEKRLANNY